MVRFACRAAWRADAHALCLHLYEKYRRQNAARIKSEPIRYSDHVKRIMRALS